MSNAITFPDHDYLGDAITLTDDAPPADELQALRAQIEALTKENKILKAAKRELKEALGQYADYRNWAGKGVDNYNHVFTFGDSNDSESGVVLWLLRTGARKDGDEWRTIATQHVFCSNHRADRRRVDGQGGSGWPPTCGVARCATY